MHDEIFSKFAMGLVCRLNQSSCLQTPTCFVSFHWTSRDFDFGVFFLLALQRPSIRGPFEGAVREADDRPQLGQAAHTRARTLPFFLRKS